MSVQMENSVPLGPGYVFFGPPKDEDLNSVSGGTGTIDWTNADTGAVIATGVAITWNAAKNRYQSRIEDNAGAWSRVVGDLWGFEVLLNATTPTAKRLRDSGTVRVRSQSSTI